MVGEKRLLQLDEMEEFHNNAYENATIYKERPKRWHGKHIMRRVCKRTESVSLNSHLGFFSGKLRSRWSRPFEVTQVFPHGAIEIHSARKERSR